MKRLAMIFLMLAAISMAMNVPAQERKMLTVEDALWNAQVGARSVPAHQTGQLSVEEAMMPLSASAPRQMLSVQDAIWNAQMQVMNNPVSFEQLAQQPSQNNLIYAQPVYASPQYAYTQPVYQFQSYPVQPSTYYVAAPVASSYQYEIPIQPVKWTRPATATRSVAAESAPVRQTAAVRTSPKRQTTKRQATQQVEQKTTNPATPPTDAAASQLMVKTAAGETQLVLSNQANAAQLDVIKIVAQQQTDQAMRQTEIEHAKTLLWLGAMASAPFVMAIGWSTKKILQELRLMADARRKYELLQQQEARKELEAAERMIDTHHS